MAHGVAVRPDVVHSYNANGAVGAMLFVDPESLEGVWLRSSLREEITLVPRRGWRPVPASCAGFSEQPLESLDIGALIRHCVQALSTGAPPSRRLDARVTRVLAAIREADDLRMSIEDAAAMVFLSPEPVRASVQAAGRPAVQALHAVAQARARDVADRP